MQTAANTPNNDTPFFELDCCCSIVPLRVLVENIIYSLRHNGVVGQNVMFIAGSREIPGC